MPCPRHLRTRSLDKIELKPKLLCQCLTEGEIGLDDGITPQGALTMNIGVAKKSLADRHTYTLVGMPDNFAPMIATRIECSTVVEDIPLDHQRRSCVWRIYIYMAWKTVRSNKG